MLSTKTLFSRLSAPVLAAALLLPLAARAAIEIDHIAEEPKGSVIHLKTEAGSPTLKPLSTPLYGVKELAFLAPSEGGTPTLLVSGLPCKDCQEKVILMLPVNGSKPFQFVYPGKIFDPKNRATLFESRAFYGKCLSKNTQDVYVVYQKERVDRRGIQSSVYIAEPGKEYIKEKLIEKRREMPSVQATLARVKTKLCHEVEGRTRPMLKKPLDLTPRKGTADDDDDEKDEDAPKENQTQDELPSKDAPTE